MTIRELIATLSQYDLDSRVFGCGGDDWGAIRVKTTEELFDVCQDYFGEEEDED